MNDRPLSVCMFSNLYPPVVSGSSTQLESLSRKLAAAGNEIAVITARIVKDSKEYEEVEGVHIYRLPAIQLPRLPISLNFPWMSYTFTPGNLRRIEEIFARHKPDIIHLHNHMFDLALSAVEMHRRTKKPLVVTIHTIVKHAQGVYNMLLYPADRILLKRLVINRASVLIAPDVIYENYARDVLGGKRIEVIPYGIYPPETARPEQVEELRTRYNLAGKRVILSLGHVHALRNRKDLVEAMPYVVEKFPDAVLLIVGTLGDELPVNLAKKLGIEKSVITTGARPHSEVPAFFALSDMECHWLNQDSPKNTSLGIASLEAMRAGKLILAAAYEGTYGPGVLRNGENIVLVEPGHPQELGRTLVGLLSDDAKREAIGRRAAQTIEEHCSWERVSSRTLETYRQVLGR